MKKHSVTITFVPRFRIKIWLLIFCFVWLVLFLGIEGRTVPRKSDGKKHRNPLVHILEYSIEFCCLIYLMV